MSLSSKGELDEDDFDPDADEADEADEYGVDAINGPYSEI